MNSEPTVPSAVAEKYAQFGATEAMSLTHIQKLTAEYLSRSWASIPHVTHHDYADVTALEQARSNLSQSTTRRVTSLAFHVKAVVAALQKFPKFNSSLDQAAGVVYFKKYFNIGIAIDTPKGLLVAVVRDAERKNIVDIAAEIDTLAAKARSKGLSAKEMSGGSFSISSLGRNGGSGFSPIINAPEVAILGTSRLEERPVRCESGIGWITALPLSLSYDHRVINGAEAAAFMTHLTTVLRETAPTWAA
jgi:pyruvate dehydrogenase E2 component (dihydrolipoamide acetyltransferase)